MMVGRNFWVIVAVAIVLILIFGFWSRGRQKTASVPSTPTLTQVSPTSQSGVSIKNFAFGPADTTVKVGETVAWVNNDSTPHTIVSDPNGAIFMSENLGQGQKYSFTFPQAGSFPYHCGLHPNMIGKITVTE